MFTIHDIFVSDTQRCFLGLAAGGGRRFPEPARTLAAAASSSGCTLDTANKVHAPSGLADRPHGGLKLCFFKVCPWAVRLDDPHYCPSRSPDLTPTHSVWTVVLEGALTSREETWWTESHCVEGTARVAGGPEPLQLACAGHAGSGGKRGAWLSSWTVRS